MLSDDSSCCMIPLPNKANNCEKKLVIYLQTLRLCSVCICFPLLLLYYKVYYKITKQIKWKGLAGIILFNKVIFHVPKETKLIHFHYLLRPVELSV